MILISHRGNLSKKNEETENSIPSINKALSLDLDVEVDVWYIDNKFYLGHDEPKYLTDINYLNNPKLWCHTKNKEALLEFKSCGKPIHYFWHQDDSFTITSMGYIWSHYKTTSVSPYSICVLPEYNTNNNIEKIKNSLGICSDKIFIYKNQL